MFSRFRICLTSGTIARRSSVSRLENASSISRSFGLGAIARAKRNALLLAARERMRHALGVARQPEKLQQLSGPAALLRFRCSSQPERDVAADIEMRKEGHVLKHHADLPTLGLHHGVRRRERLPVHGHGPAQRPFETGDPAQQSRFAAAARPQQAPDLPGFESKRGIGHHDLAPVPQRQRFDRQQRPIPGLNGRAKSCGSKGSPEEPRPARS